MTRKQKDMVTYLLKHAELNEWETDFVSDIEIRNWTHDLSIPQAKKLQEIYDRKSL